MITLPDDFSWTCVIHAKPVMKKNNLEVRKRGTARFIAPNKRYEAWEAAALEAMKSEAWRPNIPKDCPVNLRVVTYMPTARMPDLSNTYEGPQDALEHAGIIENDVCIYGHHGSARYKDADDPRTELTITPWRFD